MCDIWGQHLRHPSDRGIRFVSKGTLQITANTDQPWLRQPGPRDLQITPKLVQVKAPWQSWLHGGRQKEQQRPPVPAWRWAGPAAAPAARGAARCCARRAVSGPWLLPLIIVLAAAGMAYL